MVRAIDKEQHEQASERQVNKTKSHSVNYLNISVEEEEEENQSQVNEKGMHGKITHITYYQRKRGREFKFSRYINQFVM